MDCACNLRLNSLVAKYILCLSISTERVENSICNALCVFNITFYFSVKCKGHTRSVKQKEKGKRIHTHTHSNYISSTMSTAKKNDGFVDGKRDEKKRANKQIASELGLPFYFELTISIVSGAT